MPNASSCQIQTTGHETDSGSRTLAAPPIRRIKLNFTTNETQKNSNQCSSRGIERASRTGVFNDPGNNVDYAHLGSTRHFENPLQEEQIPYNNNNNNKVVLAMNKSGAKSEELRSGADAPRSRSRTRASIRAASRLVSQDCPSGAKNSSQSSLAPDHQQRLSSSIASDMAVSQLTSESSAEGNSEPGVEFPKQEQLEGTQGKVLTNLGRPRVELDDRGLGDAPGLLDLLAQAASQALTSSECEQDLSKPARFVHGEIPYVKKRVSSRRCGKPSKQLLLADSGESKVERSDPMPVSQDGSAAASRRRVSKIPQRFLEYEVPVMVKRVKSPKTPVTTGATEGHLQNHPVDCSSSKTKNKEEKALVPDDPKPLAAAGTGVGGVRKRRKLSEVVKQADEELARNVISRDLPAESENREPSSPALSEVVKQDDEDPELSGNIIISSDLPAESEDNSDPLPAAEVHPVQVIVENYAGAVVRSSRGRCRHLPARFEGSVMGIWKKRDRKKKV